MDRRWDVAQMEFGVEMMATVGLILAVALWVVIVGAKIRFG